MPKPRHNAIRNPRWAPLCLFLAAARRLLGTGGFLRRQVDGFWDEVSFAAVGRQAQGRSLHERHVHLEGFVTQFLAVDSWMSITHEEVTRAHLIQQQHFARVTNYADAHSIG
jgi:hypothetical protein